jgi:CrcB protein
VLGGFTTFSSFSLETLLLFEQGAWQTALLYLALSLMTCLFGVGLGVGLIRLMA